MDNLDALFTAESVASLQGAAAAALLVPNVLGSLIPPLSDLKRDLWRRWISFAVAMTISLVLALTRNRVDVSVVTIAVLNGFLVFASAVGINQTVQPQVSKRQPPPGPFDEFGRERERKRGSFWVDWFPG